MSFRPVTSQQAINKPSPEIVRKPLIVKKIFYIKKITRMLSVSIGKSVHHLIIFDLPSYKANVGTIIFVSKILHS
ncbi:hypothetical protein FHS68_001815 [Dyadobacter arcticus]|uniref:Uncharacterized protein n=1 Tax=Dyadobacter arcticus TaxID=1078754 RepID=A0ABX0ULU4_9BACT|nr:hypothetical protein [Dyadobacter arcticus]